MEALMQVDTLVSLNWRTLSQGLECVSASTRSSAFTAACQKMAYSVSQEEAFGTQLLYEGNVAPVLSIYAFST